MDQGSIDALYQSFRDAAEQGSIDALYQSFKAAKQRRTDVLCQSLRDAAEQGSIDALYALIRTNADVLDIMDKIPIVETPLHIAASLGHTEFAMEIMKLKPSFARKLNQDGFTPMHLALQKVHDLTLQKLHRLEQLTLQTLDRHENNPDCSDSQKNDALQRNLTQLVHRLLDVEKDLVRVKGKEGVTPLHYVAQIGNLDFFAKFFKACPESLEDVTIRGENVLHIALKYGMVEAFWLLVRWLRRASCKDSKLLEEKLLYSQDKEGNTLMHVDEEGNTLLHVAVSKTQPEVVWWLLDRRFADLNAKNLEDHTVFDLNAKKLEDNQQIKDMLMRRQVVDLNAKNLEDNQRIKDMLMRRQRLLRCAKLLLIPSIETIFRAVRHQQTVITEERRNALLVVAALLITVTYQAALGPDQQPNQFNCTAPINATGANHNLFNCTAWFNASREVDPSPHQGVAFYFINTLTYYLTNVTLLLLLPPDFIAIVLYYLLGLLFLCYCISTPLLNAPLVSTFGIICLLPTFIILTWLTGLITSLGKLLSFLVFYAFCCSVIILKLKFPQALTYIG